MELLNVSHLCKTYGTGESRVNALKDATFTMQKSEFAAIVGESGSGKTTLIKLANGLLTPDGGYIAVCGAAPGRWAFRRPSTAVTASRWCPTSSAAGSRATTSRMR